MRALSTWIDGFIGSAKSTGKKVLSVFGKEIPEMQEYFASDFGGHGWKIYKDVSGKYILEIDNIRVRESLIAHELVIDKIRAIAGSLGISQACGKVKESERVNNTYYLKLEGDETHGYGGFQVNDFIRCQRVTTDGVKGYWVRISSVSDDGKTLQVAATEFEGCSIVSENGVDTYEYVSNSGNMSVPTNGDEIVQYGNSTDTKRQSAIYIHANGQGQPAIDILEGISSKSFANCLTCRLGGNLPDGGGFGLYSKNGKIISKTDDVTNYELNPDGTFDLGKGAIKYDGNQVTIANSVKINWGASSQENVTYATSTNATTPPSSGWNADITKVNPQKGQYLWTRTLYPNGSYSYSVSYMAKDGEDGIPGTNGKDGKDGVSMQPNLLDYTSLPQDIFEDKPSGLTLNGERFDAIDGFGGISAEVDMGDEEARDIWIFQENVLERMEVSTWYTLSFYLRGSTDRYMATYIRSTDDVFMVDSSEKIIVDGKERTAEIGTAWTMSSSWVRHTLTFKTASKLSEKNFCILFRIFAETSQPTKSAEICQMKLERSKEASAWCMSETDKIASVVLPSWLTEWSGETTSVGAEYVAAKNAFFGKKENDKYTGIMMSSDGLTIGDKKVVGMYALSDFSGEDKKVMVAIDPVSGIYRFRGNILSEGGQFNGVTVGLSLNGISVFTEANFNSYFGLKLSGNNTYYANPDFFVVNPVMLFTYIPKTMKLPALGLAPETDVDVKGIILPSFYVGCNKLSVTDTDYQFALGFLGKTLHIINNTESSLIVKCYHAKANAFYKYMSGNYLTGTDVELENGNITIKSGKSLSMTMHLRRDSTLYWVIEDADNMTLSSVDGSVGDITILPPSNNNKWYVTSRVNTIV